MRHPFVFDEANSHTPSSFISYLKQNNRFRNLTSRPFGFAKLVF